MKESELRAEMDQVTAQVTKIGGETDSLKAEIGTLQQKVSELETALASEELSAETQTAWSAVKDQVNVVDSKVDDLAALTQKSG
jgi:uncharacterized coiled-coil DUF342 family protein